MSARVHLALHLPSLLMASDELPVYLRVHVSYAMNIHNNKNDTNPIRMSGMRPKMCVCMLTHIYLHKHRDLCNQQRRSLNPTQHQQQDKINKKSRNEIQREKTYTHQPLTKP